MIKDHLDRYYEAFPGVHYRVLRSFVINAHEVAWAEGTITRQDGVTATFREISCECSYIENVGWKIDENDRRYSMDAYKNCLPRKAAIYMRHLELRDKFLEKYTSKSATTFGAFGTFNDDHIESIILDMIEMVKNGEMIGEDSSGAAFWGGYFYLQTVAAITDRYVGHMWPIVHKMCAEKKISLDGAVVKDYEVPPPPTWEKVLSATRDGYTAIASIPGNRHMAQEWHFDVTREDGSEVYAYLPGVALTHDPVFGVDAEDVEIAKQYLDSYLNEAIKADASHAENEGEDN